jgi:pyruvate/2-oxoglutarate dehydrogenase complex dihydrolipoamide acyltransferase (E2) component
MAFEFKFPDVGEGIHEGKIVEWLIKEGDYVEIDQLFVKVETDKAVVELPVPKKGYALKLFFTKGETIKVGDVIAAFGEKGEKVGSAVSAPQQVIPEKKVEVPKIITASSEKTLATPHTRALARTLGVDISIVTPTGKNGRITDEDVENAKKGGSKPAALTSVRQPQFHPDPTQLEERVELSHLRKVIASAMIESKRTSAHVTHIDEADVTNLFALYKEMKSELQKEEKKITLMPFFIKALVLGLKRFPKFNGSVDEGTGEFIFKNYFNIGFAADTEEGLIVPVIKNADRKSLLEISDEARELSAKARSRTLSLDDIRGATCTVTNIGPLGGVFATPIIHQPELAIVGFHAIKERPWVVDGEIKIRNIMYLSISFDHKYIDGGEAARFMSHLVHLLEKPSLIFAKG